MVTHDPSAPRRSPTASSSCATAGRRRGRGRLDRARHRLLRDAAADGRGRGRDAGGTAAGASEAADAALVRRPRGAPAAHAPAALGADRVRHRARRRDGLRRAAARRDDPPHLRRPDRLGLGQDGPRSSRPGRRPAAAATRSTASGRSPASSTPAAMVGGVFVRLDAHGRAIKGAQRADVGRRLRPERAARTTSARRRARCQRAGPEMSIERNWARDRGVRRRRRASRVGDADRPRAAARRRHLRVLRAALSFGGAGPRRDAASPRRGGSCDRADRLAPDQRSRPTDRERRRRAAARGCSARSAPGSQVKTPRGLGDDISRQLQALNVVLYFFSGVALFVGGFLILNSFNMTVLQRMRELGMLRTLGATRGMVVRTVLVEALVARRGRHGARARCSGSASPWGSSR